MARPRMTKAALAEIRAAATMLELREFGNSEGWPSHYRLGYSKSGKPDGVKGWFASVLNRTRDRLGVVINLAECSSVHEFTSKTVEALSLAAELVKEQSDA